MDLKSDIGPLCGTHYPALIAGPCSVESRGQLLETAEALKGCGVTVLRGGLWKPRTKPGGFEGVGEEGIPWMLEAREKTGLKIASEAGNASHAQLLVDNGFDAIWIGARTTANPFAVQEIADVVSAAAAPVAVMVKNPVNPDLELWIGALERMRLAGVETLIAVHRGFTAYGSAVYRNPPQWSIPIELRRRFPGLPLLCDPSHITGHADMVSAVAQEALDLGFDGLMTEVHTNPRCAFSDAKQQLTPTQFCDMTVSLRLPVRGGNTLSLNALRHKIDDCDAELLAVLARRMEVSQEIGRLKKEKNLPAVHINRHDEVMRSRAGQGESLGLPPEFTEKIMRLIHIESVRRQVEILNSDNNGGE